MKKEIIYQFIHKHNPCKRCGSTMIEPEVEREKEIEYLTIACRKCGDRIIIEQGEIDKIK